MTPVADKPLTPELREGKMKSICSLAKFLGREQPDLHSEL